MYTYVNMTAHLRTSVGYPGIYTIPVIHTERRPSSDLYLSRQGIQLIIPTSTWLLVA